MHNSTITQPDSRWVGRSLLLLGLLLSLGSQQAFALIQNNLSCNPTSPTVVNLGDVERSTWIKVPMTGTCTVTRNFPYGSSLSSQREQYTPGFLLHLRKTEGGFNGISMYPWGTATRDCLPTSSSECRPLPVRTVVTYNLDAEGWSPTTTGDHSTTMLLTSTSINGYEDYVDRIQTLTINLRVINPACTMSSNRTLNLPFGALNSNEFATSQQVANITLNCPSGTQATATLVPTQSAVSGSPGVSATTLAGLSMAATWADNNSAVTFNSPRTLYLTTGANAIRLGFRPRLNTSVSPTGSFTSQYTLNINYL